MRKMLSQFWLLLALWIILPVRVLCADPLPALVLPVHWEKYTLPIPDKGVGVIGMHQGMVFAMDANTDSKAITLYFKGVNEEKGEWQKANDFIERTFGEITPLPTTEGLVFIGKSNKSNGYDRVGLLYWENANRSPQWRELEGLPVPLLNPAAAIRKGKLIVCGKEVSNRQSIRFYFRPFTGSIAWSELPALATHHELSGADIFIQSDGESDVAYLFANKPAAQPDITVGFYLNESENAWKKMNMPPSFPEVTGGITLGNAHILLLDVKQAVAYHTITNTWIQVNDFPPTGRPYHAAKDQTGFYIWTSDEHECRLYVGESIAGSPAIKLLDYLVLVAYFATVLIIGYIFSRRLKGTDDYFRGGKRIPWWAAGLSILVTKLSAITFMSLPAKAYATNWLYFWIPVGNILLAIIVIKCILPFFYRLDITSTYEYLEKRFNTMTRTIGSATYVIFEIVRMGVLLLLPAIVITVITGIDIHLCIVIIGVVVTLYTMMGGIEAVIWTDVLQAVILVSGCVAALVIVGIEIEPERLRSFLHSSVGQQKMKYMDFSADFTQATLLVIGLSWIGKLQDYVSNQAVVQRFISTKNEKAAARSIWVASLLGIPVIAMFLILGTGLFLFYEANPGRLDVFMEQPDALLATFILREMPAGISGLVMAAIFAAAMSSLDSSINSMSTVIITDFYKKFASRVTEAKSLKLAKILTIVLGAFGTASALVMAGGKVSSLYDQLFSVIGLFGGGLAGVFILGIFTRRANSAGALTGFFFSALILFAVSNYSDLHVLLYAIIGMGSCVVIGYVISLLTSARQHTSLGFTIYDMPEKVQSDSGTKNDL